MDLRYPLKRVMIVNKDEDNPIFISYEKLFEICFYYGRRMMECHLCPKVEVEDECVYNR